MCQKKASSRKNRRRSIRVPSSKKQNPKLRLSTHEASRKGLLASWKSRKKKSILKQRSLFKKITSWKRRKKKRSLVTSLEFALIRRGSSSRKVRAWKRKKKCHCSQRWLFFVFDWDPGIATFSSPRNPAFLFRPGVCERMDYIIKLH